MAAPWPFSPWPCVPNLFIGFRLNILRSPRQRTEAVGQKKRERVWQARGAVNKTRDSHARTVLPNKEEARGRQPWERRMGVISTLSSLIP